MNTKAPVTLPTYNILPTEIVGFDSLAELALDLRSSWNHGADKLWRLLDPALWELTQNPWIILQTVSHEKLESSLADPAFQKNLNDLREGNFDGLSSSGKINIGLYTAVIFFQDQ